MLGWYRRWRERRARKKFEAGINQAAEIARLFRDQLKPADDFKQRAWETDLAYHSRLGVKPPTKFDAKERRRAEQGPIRDQCSDSPISILNMYPLMEDNHARHVSEPSHSSDSVPAMLPSTDVSTDSSPETGYVGGGDYGSGGEITGGGDY